MINTPLSFHQKASGQIIDLVSKLYISFDKNNQETPILPNGFEALSYVEATGTQYIDTGLVASPKTRVLMDAQYTATTPVQMRLFGAQKTNELFYSIYINGSSMFAFTYQDNAGNWISTYKDADTKRHIFDFDGKGKIYKIDNGDFYSKDLSSYTATKSTTDNMLLFATNDQSTANNQAKAKIFSCDIYEDGTLKRAFRPAISHRKSKDILSLMDLKGSSGEPTITDPDLISRTPNSITVQSVNNPSGTWQGCLATMPTLPEGNYTLSLKCKTSATYSGRSWVSIERTPVGGSRETWYDIRIQPSERDGRTISQQINIDYGGGAYYYRINFYSSSDVASGSVQTTYYDFMLEKGSTATQYEPYYQENEVGLYDIQNDIFYPSSTTTPLLAGSKLDWKNDFQELKWIEATGTQYVNTTYMPNASTVASVNYQYIPFSSSGAIIGVRDDSREYLKKYAIWIQGSDGKTALNYGNYDSGYFDTSSIPTEMSNLTIKNKGLYKNGVLLGSNPSAVWGNCYSPLFLFSCDIDMSVDRYIKGRISSCTLSNGTRIEKNFIPVKTRRNSNNLMFRRFSGYVDSQGIRWNADKDGFVGNGTCTSSWSNVYSSTTLEHQLTAGTYTFSIKNPIGYNCTLRLYYADTGSVDKGFNATSNSVTFTIDRPVKSLYMYIGAPLASGTVVSNLRIEEPMITAGSVKGAYEPYFNANEVGMFDLVDNRFFGNSGTGNFVAGAEVKESGNFFTLDQSRLDSSDRLGTLEDNPIQLWDTYDYHDFSDRLVSVSVERSVEFPYETQSAMCDITLDNYDRYFDPAYQTSPISDNNLPSRPLKIYAGYSGETAVQQFVGLTQDMPDISTGSGTASYHAVDFLSEIASQTLNQTISMRNARTDEVLVKIVEQFGVLPSQYSFENGVNVIPFVFFDKGQEAGEAIRKLIQAEGGKFWLDEQGILRFEKRVSSSTSPVMTIPEYSILSVDPTGTSDMVNHIKINCDLREVQEFQTVFQKSGIYDNDGEYMWSIPAGASIVRECRLADPCYDIVNPTLGKNSAVSWFTAKDVNGQEVTTGITAVGELSTNAYTITFTNDNLYAVKLDEIQLWGEPAKVYDVLDYDAYEDESVQKYGEHILQINDNTFFQSYDQAQSFAKYLLNDRAFYNTTLKLRIKGDFSLQLGDIITLEGDYEGDYKIDAITWKLDSGDFSYDIKVHKINRVSFFTLDVSVLDGTDVIA